MGRLTGGLAAVTGFILSAGASVGQEGETAPRYRIKPSEVAVPPDVPIGMYRRVIHPFGNWTLICDENFKTKQKICNITQNVADESGKSIFSWSLAATAEGRPMMILRVPPAAGKGSRVSLSFPDRKKPVEVEVESCDRGVCLATVPVGPILRDNIAREATVGVSYGTGDGTISINLPLKGLNPALEAIE